MNTETETLHGTATCRFLVITSHGAGYWVEKGEPVEVRETRTGGKYVIHSRRLAAKTVRYSWDKVIARVNPS